MAKIIVTIKGKTLHEIIVDKDSVITIGRDPSNGIHLENPAVSRFHAEIRYNDCQFLLVDKNSSSGTFLNNNKITVSQLFAGDILQISHTPIMFMFKGASILDGSGKHTRQLKNFDDPDQTKKNNPLT